MLADVRAFVEDQSVDYIDEYTSTDADHGRIEERSYYVYDVPDYLTATHKWPHLQAFVHVVSSREQGGKVSGSGHSPSNDDTLKMLAKFGSICQT